MAHPYTARAYIERKIGAEQVIALCDRNGDGDEDVGVLDDAIQSACDIVDSALRQYYVVPFAAITDASPEGTVRELTTYYAIHLLFSEDQPDEDTAIYSGGWLKKFRELLARIVSGSAELGATKVAAEDGRIGISATYTENTFGIDENGGDRMRNF